MDILLINVASQASYSEPILTYIRNRLVSVYDIEDLYEHRHEGFAGGVGFMEKRLNPEPGVRAS
jgi:hypothetical protein